MAKWIELSGDRLVNLDKANLIWFSGMHLEIRCYDFAHIETFDTPEEAEARFEQIKKMLVGEEQECRPEEGVGQ